MFKKNIILLLGGNKLNLGIYKKFKNSGYDVYVVDWNEEPQLVGDKHYKLDVKNYNSIIGALERDKILNRVLFAYSSIDLAVESVAKINRAVGLRTITDEALKFACSKSMMTKKWKELGLLNKISKKYDKYDSSIFEMNTNMKIIIKPDNSASSRGITICEKNTQDHLIKEAFLKAKNEATNSTVVVEEFVDGVEYTVEMLGDAKGNVCVYAVSKKTHTNNAGSNKVAVKLHYNSVSDEIQERLAEFGIKCYKALGFTSSLGHLEVILKPDGTISPVEIGARSSGFIASDLVDIVSGASYLEDYIDVLQGAQVLPGMHSQTSKSSMYFFYDFPDGFKVSKECSLLDYLDKSINSRYYNRENIYINNIFNKIDNDNARIGFEILEGEKFILTESYIVQKEKEMLLDMEGLCNVL